MDECEVWDECSLLVLEGPEQVPLYAAGHGMDGKRALGESGCSHVITGACSCPGVARLGHGAVLLWTELCVALI